MYTKRGKCTSGTSTLTPLLRLLLHGSRRSSSLNNGVRSQCPSHKPFLGGQESGKVHRVDGFRWDRHRPLTHSSPIFSNLSNVTPSVISFLSVRSRETTHLTVKHPRLDTVLNYSRRRGGTKEWKVRIHIRDCFEVWGFEGITDEDLLG